MQNSKSFKIAIIHLDSTEEFILATAIFSPLKQKYNDCEIYLLTKKENAEIINLGINVDHTYFIDSSPIDIQINEITKLIPSFDLVINISTNPLAAQCSFLLAAEKIIGPTLYDKDNLLISDAWSRYVFSVKEATEFNTFHTLDLYKYITKTNFQDVQLLLKPPQTASDQVMPFLENITPVKIAYSVPTSEENYSWKLQEATEFIEKTLTTLPNCSVLLVGTVKDRINSTKIITSLPENVRNRCIDLTGRLTLSDLAYIVWFADIVVANSSIPLHLAASFGTLCITLLDKQISEQQLGPYGFGHIVLQPKHTNIVIPGKLVAEFAIFALTENQGNAPTHEQWKYFYKSLSDSIQSHFYALYSQRVTFTDQNNERTDLIYKTLQKDHVGVTEYLLSFYRLLWQLELNQAEDILDKMPIPDEETKTILSLLKAPLSKLQEVALFGCLYTEHTLSAIKNKNIDQAKTDSIKLVDVDELIRVLGKMHSELSPIINYYFTSQAQIYSSDPADAANSIYKCYEHLRIQSLIMIDLIETVLSQDIEKNRNKEHLLTTDY